MARRRRTPRADAIRFAFDPPAPPPRRPPRRRRLRWMRLLVVTMLVWLLAVVSAFFGFMTAIAQEKPLLPAYRPPEEIGHVYAIAGTTKAGRPIWQEIGTLRAPEARVNLKSDQISPEMKNAIVAIEDKRFYEHKGFDPEGIARALFKRVVLGSQEGASTITQQLVKRAYLSPQQSVRRKVQEVLLAYQLERRWKSKARILTEYLNRGYFGNGANGIEAAARYYFGVHAQALDTAQSALLAGVLRSPSQYDPVRHPREARDRRDLVLDKMAEQHYISPIAAEIAKAKPLGLVARHGSAAVARSAAPYFAEYVTEELKNRYGSETTFGGGLKVYTTLDLREQTLAERAVRKNLRGVGPTGALVSIEPATGEVKAMVGGSDYTKSQYNIATDGRRQPGSAFKPFVMLAALRKGIRPATRYTSHRVLLDNGSRGGWYVTNDTPDYRGSIDINQALAYSDNTVFAQLTQTVGPQNVVDMAHAMGINSSLDPTLSIGLGGLRRGVTPLEMAHAFATIANQGDRAGGSLLFHTPDAGITEPDADPISIRRVVFPSGRVDQNRTQVRTVLGRGDVGEGMARTVIDAMRGVVAYGTGTKAQLPGRPVAGKTGTTSDFLDAWFVGMVPQRVAAVWVGYPNVARPMKTEYKGKPVMGGTFPALIWKSFMAALTRGMPVQSWPSAPFVPDEAVTVDRRTGKLAPAGCRTTRELIVATDRVPGGESSCRAAPFLVPDLSGQSASAAANLAYVNGMIFIPDYEPAKPGQTPGRVVDQAPAAFTYVPNKTPVRAIIAVAAPQVYVPLVRSRARRWLPLQTALGRLRTLGFRVLLRDGWQKTSGEPDGTVVWQYPAPGALAPKGSMVQLGVIGDAHSIAVPDLTTLRLGQARSALASFGFTVAAARRAGGGPSSQLDWVVASNWNVGDRVPRGTAITLMTSRRPL